MNRNFYETQQLITILSQSKISAVAELHGRGEYKDVCGEVLFYDFGQETVVACTLHNLPNTETNIFGFHIHRDGTCDGDFSSAGPHYGQGEHPNHKGDMPVLFGNDGKAFMVFCTGRFSVEEVIGRAVIVHSHPDDYKTQPSGDSGERIACGIITKM